MSVPNKILLNPELVKDMANDSNKPMYILDSDKEDKSKCVIEYVRADAFIDKAKKWFEIQNEGVDSDGNYKCDMTDFEDFKNYMKGE